MCKHRFYTEYNLSILTRVKFVLKDYLPSELYFYKNILLNLYIYIYLHVFIHNSLLPVKISSWIKIFFYILYVDLWIFIIFWTYIIKIYIYNKNCTNYYICLYDCLGLEFFDLKKRLINNTGWWRYFMFTFCRVLDSDAQPLAGTQSKFLLLFRSEIS